MPTGGMELVSVEEGKLSSRTSQKRKAERVPLIQPPASVAPPNRPSVLASSWHRGELTPHEYRPKWNELKTKSGLLTIAALYAPSSADDDVLSSRTSNQEVAPRVKSAGFHIVNLVVGKPKANKDINQTELSRVITDTDEGLRMSINFISRIQTFVEQVLDFFPQWVPVVYFAGEIAQLAIRRVENSNQAPKGLRITSSGFNGPFSKLICSLSVSLSFHCPLKSLSYSSFLVFLCRASYQSFSFSFSFSLSLSLSFLSCLHRSASDGVEGYAVCAQVPLLWSGRRAHIRRTHAWRRP